MTFVDTANPAAGAAPAAGRIATRRLLEVRGLRTYFWHPMRRAFVRSVDGVDLDIAAGETLGV
ncbi:MAG TPA: hypothetical protein VF406_05535, partial [Thermodesulfobacteriota bacterium]